MSCLEPNSTEDIWKNPLPVLDWTSSESTGASPFSMDTSSKSGTLPDSNVSPIDTSMGWQPPSFGSVPHADEFFENSMMRQVTPLTVPQCPQRQSFGNAVFDSDIHFKLSTEVLFYIFYFQGDKLARVQAARDLEHRNWSFYTKLSVWIQRMEFPRIQTAEYERGNFRYWDNTSWKEEKLTDFLIDYAYVKNPSEELLRLC